MDKDKKEKEPKERKVQDPNKIFEPDVLARTYAFQRTEILDKETCADCRKYDGIIVLPGDERLQHAFEVDCRGQWVAILNDEVNPPPPTPPWAITPKWPKEEI